ncbi:MAG: NADP-dependent malic enzyme [Anaerolineae bacterium]|nr:NADP-dependent malic enzyme [Anaerolineae bacterium]
MVEPAKPIVTKEELLEKAKQPAIDAMRLHPFYRGKIQTALRASVRSIDDFAIWYTPGVAAPCKAIAENPSLVYEYTSKWNTVAVISDGTRVLGLGDIGPEAGLPVMEGKALLFKYLGGVDCVPITLDTKDPDKIIDTVLMLQPAFGGINLEDISQPKCFRILDTLRERARIPVWHDDQQGTASVTLAGMLNAARVVGKRLEDMRIVFLGAGAANVACSRLLFSYGVDPGNCLVADENGILGKHRRDIALRKTEYVQQWRLCQTTNDDELEGDAADALRGADAVVAFSAPGPGTIQPEWIRSMAKDAIVIAAANPIPEIWPWEALEAGAAVVATGRSDFPNQVNNSLGFPGIFRGALDVRASTITDEMAIAAAEALASLVPDDQLSTAHLLPTMDDWEIFPREAAAVAVKAVEQGVAALPCTYEEEFARASEIIRQARDMTQMLMDEHFIADPPVEN